MSFEDGVTANLLMHGFAATRTNRETRVFGSSGYLEGNLHQGTIQVSAYGKEPYEIDVNAEMIDRSHLGGDAKLVKDYVSYKNGEGKPMGISLLSDSVYSHILAFKAEESRCDGGKSLEVNYDA